MRRLTRSTSFTVLLLSLACLAPSSFASNSSGTQELAYNWKLISARKVTATGDAISQPAYSTSDWHPIRHMPATVLEILEEDGVYPNLYYGMNLATEVPSDLYKQDWWYPVSYTHLRAHETGRQL